MELCRQKYNATPILDYFTTCKEFFTDIVIGNSTLNGVVSNMDINSLLSLENSSISLIKYSFQYENPQGVIKALLTFNVNQEIATTTTATTTTTPTTTTSTTTTTTIISTSNQPETTTDLVLTTINIPSTPESSTATIVISTSNQLETTTGLDSDTTTDYTTSHSIESTTDISTSDSPIFIDYITQMNKYTKANSDKISFQVAFYRVILGLFKL